MRSYAQWGKTVSDSKRFPSHLAVGTLTVVDAQAVTVGGDRMMQIQDFAVKPANTFLLMGFKYLLSCLLRVLADLHLPPPRALLHLQLS